MDIQKLRKLRDATPFQSFLLKLLDGREFSVEQPCYIGFSRNEELVLVSARQGTAWFRPNQVTDVLHGELKR
jgi:hypothetical protein